MSVHVLHSTPADSTLPVDHITPEWASWWLPEPVGLWVDAQHQALGVPKVMAIAAALCAACTVLQGRAVVQVKPGWTEPLLLYWLVFSPTGTRKSALLRAATAPIRAMQAAVERELRPEISRIHNERCRVEKQIERIRRTVKAHKYTEGAQETLQQLRELEHELTTLVVPVVPRWLYDDINPTVVPRKLRHNVEAEGIARLSVLDAEGTFLSNLLGRHSGSTNVDALLKAYSGEPIDMVRTVQGMKDTVDVHIENAHVTLLLLIQPHLLDRMTATNELSENGFIGRCMITRLPHNDKALSWETPPVPDSVQDGYDQWLTRLAEVPVGTTWSMPEGLNQAMADMHHNLEADRLRNDGAAGWLTRTLGRICRIMAIVRLSEREKEVSLLRDRALFEQLKRMIYDEPRAQAQEMEPVSRSKATELPVALEWIKKRPSFRLREYYKARRIRKDLGLAVMDELVSMGLLEQSVQTRLGNVISISYRVIPGVAIPTMRREP